MRILPILCLSLMSCGQPLPGDGQPGQEGQPGQAGAAGERGAQGAPGKDAVVAGSRLRPLWLVGADGSRQTFANGFYDTQRRENCIVQLMQGGDLFRGPWVCAPLGTAPKDAAPYVAFSVE